MEGFLNPNEVLKQLKLKKDMLAADFGCGAGGWAIPLAKILEKGKVFVFDIQEEMLSGLISKAKLENIQNIVTKRCNLEEPKSTGFEDSALDLVLIPNLLFQIENRKAIIEEAKRILKKSGEILVLDWTPGAHLGPKESRVSEEEVKKIAKELGLKLKKEFRAGSYHYGLIFKK